MLVAAPFLSSKMSLHCVSRRSNFYAKVGREGHAVWEAADTANSKAFLGAGGTMVPVSVIVNVVFEVMFSIRWKMLMKTRVCV